MKFYTSYFSTFVFVCSPHANDDEGMFELWMKEKMVAIRNANIPIEFIFLLQ